MRRGGRALFEGPLHCSGARRRRGRPGTPCGQLLCHSRDVLSRQHCWAPPGGPTEDAWYLNGFVEDSVVVEPGHPERLAQGPMEVADVSCSRCLGVVGWKFCSDLGAVRRNRHQVGRFGLCLSSIVQSSGHEVTARATRWSPLPAAAPPTRSAAPDQWVTWDWYGADEAVAAWTAWADNHPDWFQDPRPPAALPVGGEARGLDGAEAGQCEQLERPSVTALESMSDVETSSDSGSDVDDFMTVVAV